MWGTSILAVGLTALAVPLETHTPDGLYYPMSNLVHDYAVDEWGGGGLQLTNIGPITYDGSDYPYDDNSITWLASCPRTCS
jgi:hypothetical protein